MNIPHNYIKISEIESSLQELREKHLGDNLVHASLFNLVIYVKKDLREDYLQKIAKTIIKKYPCRMIFITEFEQTNNDFLRAYVTDIKPDENSTIYCEMINFEVSGSFKERIPYALLSHLLPERPVYLLWGDDPLKKDPVILKLENRATRTIFDSESSENIVDFAKLILGHQKTVFCDIADLNWARTSSWRDLFANTFNAPERLKALESAKEIQIVYNTKETQNFCHTKIQSIYFQGWLASKLGWQFETVLGSNEELSFKYATDCGGATLTLSPGKQEDLAPGRILSTELYSHHGDRISFSRDRLDSNQIAIHHCSPDICDMPFHYRFNQEMSGRSMMREIYNQGTDPSFLKVLELITSCNQGMLA